MKIIIAGSRTITNYNTVKNAIEQSGWLEDISEIVSGCAKGVDTLAIKYAQNFGIAVTHFPADWKKYNKSAGYIRNIEMAEYANRLIAIQMEGSVGTVHMVKTMTQFNKRIFLVRYNYF